MAGDRTFRIALILSFFFHMSMVTLFSVVILFPRETLDYYSFEIVDPSTLRPVGPFERQLLRLPTLEEALASAENGAGQDAALETTLNGMLPEIDLPKLEFAQLERLRIREKGLEVRSRYTDLLAPRPRDTWARFGEEIGRFGDALSRIGFVEWFERDKAAQPHVVSRPAPGFEAYIEWMSEPKDRQLILAPPVEALWGADAGHVDFPVSLVFRVSAEGKVLEVLTPVEDEAGLVANMGRALLRYRFEPLGLESGEDQYGTLIISGAENQP